MWELRGLYFAVKLGEFWLSVKSMRLEWGAGQFCALRDTSGAQASCYMRNSRPLEGDCPREDCLEEVITLHSWRGLTLRASICITFSPRSYIWCELFIHGILGCGPGSLARGPDC